MIDNGRKFPKRVENTVGKGEIVRYEQFLPFPSVFLKGLYCRHLKTRACFGKENGLLWINNFLLTCLISCITASNPRAYLFIDQVFLRRHRSRSDYTECDVMVHIHRLS